MEIEVLHRQGKSIREIARETSSARNTLRSVLRGLNDSQYGQRGATATKLQFHQTYPPIRTEKLLEVVVAFFERIREALRRNGFRKKFDDYVRSNPNDTDLKRKAYTAVAAKMARVVYGLVKTNTDYRHFLQHAA